MSIFRSLFQGKGLGEPDVIVDFGFDRGLLFITVSNIGVVPAYGISVAFDQEIWGVEGRKLISEMPLFKAVEFMPPQKHITTVLDTSASYFGRGQPTKIETLIAFRDRRGRRYANRIRHDLEIYRDLGYVEREDRRPS